MDINKNKVLSIIGAGSNYTPVLIESLLKRFKEFPFDEINLMDISPWRLEIIGNFIKFQLEKNKLSTKVNLYNDLYSAFKGADIVLSMYRVGGLEARHFDTVQAIKQDVLGQETQGWGGFASSLRNIPLAIQISTILDKVSPEAWLVNITNPVGIITQTCCRFRNKHTIGICEIPMRMEKAIIKSTNLNYSKLDFSYIGLNHLSWITDIRLNNKSILDKIMKESIEDILHNCLIPNIPNTDSLINIAKALRAIQSPYLRYYYMADKMIKEIKSKPKTRAQICIEIDKNLMNLYAKYDSVEWLVLSEQRGGFLLGPCVADLIGILLFEDQKKIVLCIPNNNTLPFLTPNTVIETNTQINKNSWVAYPPSKDKIHPHIKGYMSQIAAYEELTVEAGVNGDYNAALSALANHPLIPSVSIAQNLLDENILINKDFLPQFK